MKSRRSLGFTLIEVLVALTIVALALAALMSAVSSTARASGYLRDKTVAQWIALNRIAEVRLNLQQFGGNADAGELDFANRHWRYQTQYFNTDTPSIRRIVVKVWPAGAASGGTAGSATGSVAASFYKSRTEAIASPASNANSASKEPPLAESASFLGSALSPAGTSNGVDWTQGSAAANLARTPGNANAVRTLQDADAGAAATSTPLAPPDAGAAEEP